MSTQELRKEYRARLEATLEDLGFRRSTNEFVRRTPHGTEILLPAMTATYGRITTRLHLKFRHDEFEELVRTVLSEDLLGMNPTFTILRPLKTLTSGLSFEYALEVNAHDDIDRVVALIGEHASSTAADYWNRLRSLSEVVSEMGYIVPAKFPVALYLQGDDAAVAACLDEWITGLDTNFQALGIEYRANLERIADARPGGVGR